ncbi:MAG: helix-turn-helix domain-containing protein [Candidatus Diapherotrites archaeon]|nr:MAG: hypothetical protein QT12_C0001G0004 [archaeon GW2011_AR21]MBS3057897.1 helix-turn-helix domain-containing protein [Candidatus Diapherotrites archaeon]HIH33190.1 helix-turn-helix domain-containing protein [Candidatus Diapherotrites archaeon]
MKALVIKVGGSMVEDMRKVFENPRLSKPGTHTIYVKTWKDISELLSPKRLELLAYLIKENGENVSQLASRLKRKQEAVSRDAGVLEKHSLLEKAREGQSVCLKAKYKTLEIRLSSA